MTSNGSVIVFNNKLRETTKNLVVLGHTARIKKKLMKYGHQRKSKKRKIIRRHVVKTMDGSSTT